MEWRVIFCTELSSAERDEPKEKEEEGSDPVCLLNLRSREGRKEAHSSSRGFASVALVTAGGTPSFEERGPGVLLRLGLLRSGLLLCPSVKAHVDENSNMLERGIVRMPLP